MKIVAIIQARMDSSRLPGKVLMNINGKPEILYLLERIKPSKIINEFWLATSIDKKDDPLGKLAKENNIFCYRGSENDVLERYYQTAVLSQADVVVRITGDCPLHDYQVIDKVVESFLDNKNCSYASNINPPTYPDGLDVEVISFTALERARNEASLKSEHEHVTPYIRNHPELFNSINISNNVDYSSLRLTLDTIEDLDLIRKVAAACMQKSGYCGLKELVEILNKNPNWKKINSKNIRNEGYLKSLADD